MGVRGAKSNSSRNGAGGTKDFGLESRALAEALMNAPDDYVAVLSREGKILTVSEAVCRRFGKTREALAGCVAEDIFEPEVAERRMSQFEKACLKGEVVRFEDERQGRFYDHILYPIKDAENKVLKVVSVARDITAHKCPVNN